MPKKKKKKPVVNLIREDGNAFHILALVKRALEKAGMKEEAEKFLTEARSGDYDHLLQTVQEYVEVR